MARRYWFLLLAGLVIGLIISGLRLSWRKTALSRCNRIRGRRQGKA